MKNNNIHALLASGLMLVAGFVALVIIQNLPNKSGQDTVLSKNHTSEIRLMMDTGTTPDNSQ